MTKFKCIKDTIFDVLTSQDQISIRIKPGDIAETDGKTIWWINEKGDRVETIDYPYFHFADTAPNRENWEEINEHKD